MHRFLAAQACDPFDPAPMLIHADWLEAQGDATGAAGLRGLAASGTPSLHVLALEATLRSVTSRFEGGYGIRSDTGSGVWDGYGYIDEGGVGHGDRDGIASGDSGEDGGGCGFGSGDGDTDE